MAHSDSDLSSLSSAPPTDDEADMAIDEPVGIAKYFKKESETPPPKREPSPPHEFVLADNPHIAVSYCHFEWLRSIFGYLAISMTR